MRVDCGRKEGHPTEFLWGNPFETIVLWREFLSAVLSLWVLLPDSY